MFSNEMFNKSFLLTYIPIEAVSVVWNMFHDDETLDERTCLSPMYITELFRGLS